VKVLLTWFLKKEETARLYKNCHVFVMPSLADCNPLSFIEAAKAGNVLLASKGVGNYPELVNGNGYILILETQMIYLRNASRSLMRTKRIYLKWAKNLLN